MCPSLSSSIMPRTTLDLDAAVLGELRRRGQRDRKSMGQVASELLAEALAEGEAASPTPFRWRTADLGRPLVDLEDDEALHAVLDGRS
jgi:hypothetical protein